MVILFGGLAPNYMGLAYNSDLEGNSFDSLKTGSFWRIYFALKIEIWAE